MTALARITDRDRVFELNEGLTWSQVEGDVSPQLLLSINTLTEIVREEANPAAGGPIEQLLKVLRSAFPRSARLEVLRVERTPARNTVW